MCCRFLVLTILIQIAITLDPLRARLRKTRVRPKTAPSSLLLLLDYSRPRVE